MEENVLDIEGLHAQFEEWCGNNIHIEKNELRDRDDIQMVLDSMTYDENTHKNDDYEATYTLRLNGIGNIMTEKKEQELPDGVYEIKIMRHSRCKETIFCCIQTVVCIRLRLNNEGLGSRPLSAKPGTYRDNFIPISPFHVQHNIHAENPGAWGQGT